MEYLIRVAKESFTPNKKRFTPPIKKQELMLQLLLEKDIQEIEPYVYLAQNLDIPIIYFDFDKFNVRYDSEIELQKVLAGLNKYPTIWLSIFVRILIVDDQRHITKGYGESRLVNNCGCEPIYASSCSEVVHQLNRCSEFIITCINGITCDE